MAHQLRALAALVKNMGFCSQHLRGSLQASVTPVPGIQSPPLASLGTRHTHVAHTYI